MKYFTSNSQEAKENCSPVLRSIDFLGHYKYTVPQKKKVFFRCGSKYGCGSLILGI